MSELKEAKAFKEMLLEASSSLITAHIEGVFAVFESQYKPQQEWISVDTAEDMPIGEEVLCWDGCQYHLDYADMDAESGAHYMANGTEVESYQLLTPPTNT